MRKFNQEELVEKIRSERRHMTELYDEINQLKQENASLKEYVKSLKDECISCPENKKNVKQAKIDVLNKVMNYINNKIENDYGDMSDSVNYLTINIDDFDDFIDELIKEVQNDK